MHISLPFALLAASIGAQQPGGGEARGFIEPAGEQRALAQSGGFAGENHENSLRHVLCVIVIAGAAPRDGIDEGDVPPHQFGEGGLGIVSGIFPHQIHVCCVRHLMNYPRQRQK